MTGLAKYEPDRGSNTYQFRDFYIPDRMMTVLKAYVEHHRPVGSFLTAVLENNLKMTIGHADEENEANLPAYIGWLYNEAPRACWGSPENVRKWLEKSDEEN